MSIDNKTLYNLSYGLFVVTAKDGGFDNGCIINTAMQAASNPTTISLCINKDNLTHDMVLKTKKCNLSIISEDASFDLFKHFGFQTGKEINKFVGYTDCYRANNDLMVINKGVNSYICIDVTDIVDLGSHTMFIGTIQEMEVLTNAPSVVAASTLLASLSLAGVILVSKKRK